MRTGGTGNGAQKKRRTHVKDEFLPQQSKAHNPKSFVLKRGKLAVRAHWALTLPSPAAPGCRRRRGDIDRG